MRYKPVKPESRPFDLQHSLLIRIPEADRESFVQQFTSLRFCREQLVIYFKKELDDEVKRAEELSQYNSPSWSELQADSIGYRRAMRKIINILGGDELYKKAVIEEENDNG